MGTVNEIMHLLHCLAHGKGSHNLLVTEKSAAAAPITTITLKGQISIFLTSGLLSLNIPSAHLTRGLDPFGLPLTP